MPIDTITFYAGIDNLGLTSNNLDEPINLVLLEDEYHNRDEERYALVHWVAIGITVATQAEVEDWIEANNIYRDTVAQLRCLRSTPAFLYSGPTSYDLEIQCYRERISQAQGQMRALQVNKDTSHECPHCLTRASFTTDVPTARGPASPFLCLHPPISPSSSHFSKKDVIDVLFSLSSLVVDNPSRAICFQIVPSFP